jgi:hypothetical protein
MITAVNRPAVRTIRAAAPGAGTAAVRFGARRVVRVQASPDPPKVRLGKRMRALPVPPRRAPPPALRWS